MARRRGPTAGFTLIELMIVVVIVAILALAATPMYTSQTKAGKMSEGIQGVGVIRSALRAYAAGHNGNYPMLNDARGDALDIIQVAAEDLEGKYFTAQDYLVNSDATSYTIRVTLSTDSDCWYELDQDGNETRNAF